MKNEDKKFFLGEAQFTFGQFRMFAGVNDSTLRAWMKRHLPDVGTKMPNGKMLFSGVDCIYIKLFSELTTKLSVPPTASKEIVLIGLARILELVSLTISDTDEYEPIFHVFENVNDGDLSISPMIQIELESMFRGFNPTPLIIVPIDALFWESQEKLFMLMEYNEKAEAMKRNMKPMTYDEFNQKYEESFGEKNEK